MRPKRSSLAGMFAGYGMVVGLVAVTAVLVLVHGGKILNFGFPLLATAVAWALFLSRRSVYVAFVWWIWLFTPLVRRLVDYQTGFHNISPVMVTPLLVTGFALVALARRPRFVLRGSMTPFFLLLLAFAYALVVGALTNGLLPATFDFANWVLPVAFALFLMMDAQAYAEIRAALVFAILSGLLATSVYGLYQFYEVPPWDAYWINASKLTTIGQAVSGQIRLFSTLNSAGVYALMLMPSLVLVMVGKGPLRVAAGAFGFPAFALTLVRSAWGDWALAAIYVVWRVGGKTRVRILGVGLALSVVAVPLLTAGPVADAVSKRFSSLSDIQNDSSYKARQSLYGTQVISALSDPIGAGFGELGLAAKLSTGQDHNFDSGVLLIPFEFGWLGGGLFIWAVGVLLLRALSATRRSNDRFAIAGAGIFIAMLTQNIFASTFGGSIGLATWSGLALALGPAALRRSARVGIAMTALPIQEAI